MMSQKVGPVLIAMTRSKWTRVAATAFALLIAALTVSGCKHPH